jgi:hypothetical protein
MEQPDEKIFQVTMAVELDSYGYSFPDISILGQRYN